MDHTKQVQCVVEAITLHSPDDEHVNSSFSYNAETGFLHDDSNRLLLFRAEQAGATSISRRAIEAAASDAQQVYGRGVYFGNTPESVAPYAWLRDNTAIHAYVTPPIKHEDILALPFQTNREALAEIASIVRTRRRIGATALTDRIDASYGDTSFVARDMGYDIKTGQQLSSSGDHTLPPRWGVLRSSPDNLQQIGTATSLSQPHAWALALATRAKSRRDATPSRPALHGRQ